MYTRLQTQTCSLALMMMIFLAMFAQSSQLCTRPEVIINTKDSTSMPSHVGEVHQASIVSVSCATGQLELNGVPLYRSSIIYSYFNFTAGGAIVCKCSHDTTSGHVKLIDPPVFPSESITWSVKAGDTLVIPCLHGNRYPEIQYTTQWLKESGSFVRASKRVRMEGQNLIIMGVLASDASVKYKCRVFVNGHYTKFESPLYSIAILSVVEPILVVNSTVAVCTSRKDGYYKDRTHCIATTHRGSGLVHSYCNRGNTVLAPLVGVTYVECTVEQRANGSSSVISSKTGKQLQDGYDNGTTTRGGLAVQGRLVKGPTNNTLAVEVSFRLTPPTHSSRPGSRAQLYVGTIKWDHSSHQPTVHYRMKQEQLPKS